LKKYAIFGGSFDPPHLCHEKIASLCIEELKLDKLFVVPTFLSPFKNSFAASPDVRHGWLREIFKERTDIEVLDIEIRKKRAVYMIETATEITKILGKQSCDKIYLIIGSDNLVDLRKWHRYEELIELVEPVIVSREGIASDTHKTILLDCSFSSSGFRKSLDALMIPEKIREAVMSFYKGKN
jgi:nicotinate-nucleotide adenylyltransferase